MMEQGYWTVNDYGTHMNLDCSDCGERTCVDHGTDVEEDYKYCPKCGKPKEFKGRHICY